MGGVLLPPPSRSHRPDCSSRGQTPITFHLFPARHPPPTLRPFRRHCASTSKLNHRFQGGGGGAAPLAPPTPPSSPILLESFSDPLWWGASLPYTPSKISFVT